MATIIDGSGSATFATPLPMAQVADLGLPAYGRVVRTAGNITTTSTSLVDVTGATITFTTGAFPVAYGASQSVYHSADNGEIYFNVDIDGALQHGTSGQLEQTTLANTTYITPLVGQSVALSAGAHTIKEVWRVATGTGSIQAGTALNHLFYAHEIR